MSTLPDTGVRYSLRQPEEWEPPEDHVQGKYSDIFIAPDEVGLDALETQGIIEVHDWNYSPNGSTDPTPDSQKPEQYLTTQQVLDEANEDSPGQLGSDSRKAYHTFRAIEKRGIDKFIATADREVFWYNPDDGIWHGGEDGEDRLGRLGLEALADQYSKNTLSELVEQVVRSKRVERDQLGVPEGTVATPSGLLHLRSRDLRPLQPDDYALNRITVAPDTETEIDGSRFDSFLEESVPDEDERRKLQEFAGYTLLPGQPFKKAAFLIGPTDSGKGTFLKALMAVLGEDNVASQSLRDLIDSRWGLDKIYGKMANIRNEVTPKGISNIQKFKEMTGGEDRMSAESKGSPTYEFTVTQKFLFATNQFPRVPHADDAFFNRCLFVKFPNSVPDDEKDPSLQDELHEERPIILGWMLEGIDRLLENEQFSGERPIDDKRSLTKSFGSPVTQFVYDFLEITGDPEDKVHKSGLYQAFARFCHFNEFDETPVQATFTKDLKKQSGVSEGQSRQVGDLMDDADAADRPDVFTGIRVEEGLLKKIQAEVPAYIHSDDDVEDLNKRNKTQDRLDGF